MWLVLALFPAQIPHPQEGSLVDALVIAGTSLMFYIICQITATPAWLETHPSAQFRSQQGVISLLWLIAADAAAELHYATCPVPTQSIVDLDACFQQVPLLRLYSVFTISTSRGRSRIKLEGTA